MDMLDDVVFYILYENFINSSEIAKAKLF